MGTIDLLQIKQVASEYAAHAWATAKPKALPQSFPHRFLGESRTVRRREIVQVKSISGGWVTANAMITTDARVRFPIVGPTLARKLGFRNQSGDTTSSNLTKFLKRHSPVVLVQTAWRVHGVGVETGILVPKSYKIPGTPKVPFRELQQAVKHFRNRILADGETYVVDGVDIIMDQTKWPT